MVLVTQGTTQVYSPFGSYVVEQHDSSARGLFANGASESKAAGPTKPAAQTVADDTRKAA